MRGPAARRVRWSGDAIVRTAVVAALMTAVPACTGDASPSPVADAAAEPTSPPAATSPPAPRTSPPEQGASSAPRGDPAGRPNVILVVTDDQSAASMRGAPVAMPWLRARLEEPGWTTFANAVVTTPLCCPSRATILTGALAAHTGVLTNGDGAALDETETAATWLHDAGYRTALVGKYLNGYPWEGRPLVPVGWDRWFAKLNVSDGSLYTGYDVIDDGTRRSFGAAASDYATDLLMRQAASFVAETPARRPFFLYVAPSAPHPPAEPAARHASLLARPVTAPGARTLAAMNDVTDGPAWLRSLPRIDVATATSLEEARLRERATLRAVDDGLRSLWAAVAARGDLDRTVWFLVSDNGYSFGDRRWIGKICPWETCIHVPFVAHVPWTRGGVSDALVGNVDIAPTIADLAGTDTSWSDGVSLTDLLEGGRSPARRSLPISWVGDDRVPAWQGIRFPQAVLIRHDDGTTELYDLAADPAQRRNLADDPAASRLRNRAERALARSLARVGTGG
ncbi:MAG TPA: sulfatase-like hydrolase/transferase [Actinomycetota bacterium]|nr:sulfatase-like hydrolase/transferase [Actinomycetota bacterium]